MNLIRNLILDMDGVLWRGSTAVPGLTDFIATLHRQNINFVFATNNASRTIDGYIAKFSKMGVTVSAEQILTAGYTTASHLAQKYPSGSSVFVLGYDGLHHALRQVGFNVINNAREQLSPADIAPHFNTYPHVDLVVVGFNLNVNYTAFALAAGYINRGATFYGSNADSSFPHETGTLPGAGSFLALLETATGATPTVIGKPNRYIFEEALVRLGGSPADTAMVGDRLNTDVQGAKNSGLNSILVYSGIATPDDVAVSELQPDYIFDDIVALGNALDNARG